MEVCVHVFCLILRLQSVEMSVSLPPGPAVEGFSSVLLVCLWCWSLFYFITLMKYESVNSFKSSPLTFERVITVAVVYLFLSLALALKAELHSCGFVRMRRQAALLLTTEFYFSGSLLIRSLTCCIDRGEITVFYKVSSPKCWWTHLYCESQSALFGQTGLIHLPEAT